MSYHNGRYIPDVQPWRGYYITAYQIAVKHGFPGTEAQWLASLKGEPGDPVTWKGQYESLPDLEEAHPTGESGDAYLVGSDLYWWDESEGGWVDAGSIQGPAGKAATIQVGQVTVGDSVSVTNSGTESAAVFDFTIPQGAPGKDGTPGKDGAPGADGAPGKEGPPGEAAGFGTPVVTVDGTSGTPSATVEASGPDTAKVFTFHFSGLKGADGAPGQAGAPGEQGEPGAQGAPGAAAGFGTVSATVDATAGTPQVDVQTSGPDTAKNIAFSFTGLKGQKGDKGDTGTGLDILGTYDSLELLQQGVSDPQQGDMYNVGTVAPYTIYMWDETEAPGQWVSQGQIQGAKGDKGDPGEDGAPGAKGDPGTAAGFGTPTATVDGGTGTPSVEVTASGPDTAKVFAFAFHDLKGPKGDQGDPGTPGADGQTGAKGDPGEAGEDATINGVNALTLTASGGLTGQQSGSTYTIDGGGKLDAPSGGTAGQVLQKTETGAEWADAPSGLPDGGTDGQILTRTTEGAAWEDAPSGLPEGGTEGQVLTKTADGEGWEDPKGANSTTVTLTTSGWTGDAAPYSQQVSCSIVAADSPVVTVDASTPGTDADADAAVLEAWVLVTLRDPAQGAGTLTFYCYEKPTVNIPVKVGVL